MPEAMLCEIITWRAFETLCRKLAFQVRRSGFSPDMIVAINRGGYMPARMLSDFFGLMDLASMRILHYQGCHKEPVAKVRYPLNAEVRDRRVLLVDDVSDSGDTFAIAMDHLLSRGTPAEIRTAALHHKITARFVPDFYAKKITRWRWLIYPWALTEDIGTFIDEIDPPPETLDAIARQLQRNHGIRLPPRRLSEIVAMLDDETLPSA